MIVNQEIIDKLLSQVNERKIARAMKYKKEGRINICKMEYKSAKNFMLMSKIVGKDEIYECKLEVAAGEIMHKRCTCADFTTNLNICKHLIATLLEFNENPKYARMLLLDKVNSDAKEDIKPKATMQETAKYIDGLNLINTFYNKYNLKYDEAAKKESKKKTNVTTGVIKIVPKIEVNVNKQYLISFKVGDKQLYTIKDLVEFADRFENKEVYKYGLSLELKHDINYFDEKSQEYLKFILKNADLMRQIGKSMTGIPNYYGINIKKDSINLVGNAMDDLFEIAKDEKIFLESQFGNLDLTFVDENPNIKFELLKSSADEYKLVTDIKNFDLIEGKEYNYIYIDGKIYRCHYKIEEGAITLLETFKRLKTQQILFNEKDIPTLFQIVLPNIKKSFDIEELRGTEVEKYIPESLGVKIYLDIDKASNVVMNVTFCYLDKEFNPLEDKEVLDKIDVRRNSLEEREARHIFAKTGFKEDLKNKNYILKDDDDVYNFLTETIEEYMEKFEVLVTDRFKEKQVITPRLGTIGIKVENNLLSLDFSELEIDKEELQSILKHYIVKKKYHRLKDGTYINLEDNEDIKMLKEISDTTLIDFKEFKKDSIELPIYRGIYLDKILGSTTSTLKIKKEDSFKNLIDKIENNKEEDLEPVAPLNKILRSYQLTGYRWLKSLDAYNFGGILADDMGLGKTLQIISLIATYVKENEVNRKPSLIVCPSSLTLNWKNEFKKFTENLNILVVKGKAEERRELISKANEYDALVTSYDSLKRDIESYENMCFKYIIADEAQYIKNSSTQNALALKKVQAETRFALTGTPIENSLSELWSIMDFIMPGYLYTYTRFKKNFELPIIREEDKGQMIRLKELISPFILRRLKKDVLTELPDKNITVLTNEMSKEQQKLYTAYMQDARREVTENINNEGFEKSQIKILSLLTRLRQICCHPSLFIENYKGESSKLEQCIELIEDAISSSHKILLFSQYTSMFEIIEKYLEERNIKFFKLTGSTKVDERIRMVDDFNKDDSVKVFLISLKAGGTGLNLTGADVVIHFDPWWNISAENQATDRAYRIGQKNSVQVYKLITSNSIEEKIYELQEKKSALSENMLDNKETFINKLSKEDILSLFED